MANIGKNIRRLRNSKHMTQDDLAEKLFVSRQTVSNYETGKSNPDIDMLLKIAEVLEADVNVLIFGAPDTSGRSRDIRRLITAGAVLAVLAVLYLRLAPWARELMMTVYISSPFLWLHFLLPPVLLLLTGWVFMQFARVFMKARSLSGKWAATVFYAAVFLVVLYFVSVLPFLIEDAHVTFSYLAARRDPAISSVSSADGPHLFPEFIRNYSGLAVNRIYTLRSSFLLYILWPMGGIILWNGPAHRKKEKLHAGPER